MQTDEKARCARERAEPSGKRANPHNRALREFWATFAVKSRRRMARLAGVLATFAVKCRRRTARLAGVLRNFCGQKLQKWLSKNFLRPHNRNVTNCFQRYHRFFVTNCNLGRVKICNRVMIPKSESGRKAPQSGRKGVEKRCGGRRRKG